MVPAMPRATVMYVLYPDRLPCVFMVFMLLSALRGSLCVSLPMTAYKRHFYAGITPKAAHEVVV